MSLSPRQRKKSSLKSLNITRRILSKLVDETYIRVKSKWVYFKASKGHHRVSFFRALPIANDKFGVKSAEKVLFDDGGLLYSSIR